eukprot:gnl/Spiro4/24732_TR12289_c0_g1_i1.p1 gnl/Spiro4/24732_TR12289_c0_g1~~gnl/Spiro4/24732_TR12289_c0_g1_i1.p1  ORF type:complete len:391 (+),score=73.56 gnl/Spiro4/24732_TR12289_c0_g1_i1:102-1274(+)
MSAHGWLCVFVFVVFALVFVSTDSVAGNNGARFTLPPTVVIIDTDLGNDIDDQWAILLALRMPEVDCRLIVTATHDTPARTQILAKFLTEAHRDSIPIGVGLKQTGDAGVIYDWARDFNVSSYRGPVYQDGVEAMANVIKSLGPDEPVVILELAPFGNLASFAARFPELLSRVQVLAMGGALYYGYNHSANFSRMAEYNIVDDVPSAQAVFNIPSAAWRLPLVLNPLDTCGLAQVGGDFYQKILSSEASDPGVAALLDCYRFWTVRCPWSNEGPLPSDPKVRTSVLYDPLTVALFRQLYAPPSSSNQFTTLDQVKATVLDNGHTVVASSATGGQSPATATIFAALQWIDSANNNNNALSGSSAPPTSTTTTMTTPVGLVRFGEFLDSVLV